MNAWHDIDFGEGQPEIVNAVIEVPKGSKNKYEIDKFSGFLKLDRVLHSSVHYPTNYGFIPRTLGQDNDPLDILVLCQDPVYPLTIVASKPIGVMRMQDQGEIDDKIIAVHINDPEYSDYKSIRELPAHRLKEIKRFFLDYKILENKQVEVSDFLDLEDTYKIITEAIEAYSQTYPKKKHKEPK